MRLQIKVTLESGLVVEGVVTSVEWSDDGFEYCTVDSHEWKEIKDSVKSITVTNTELV